MIIEENPESVFEGGYSLCTPEAGAYLSSVKLPKYLERAKGIAVVEGGPFQRLEVLDQWGKPVSNPLDLVIHRLLEEGSPKEVKEGLQAVAELYSSPHEVTSPEEITRHPILGLIFV